MNIKRFLSALIAAAIFSGLAKAETPLEYTPESANDASISRIGNETRIATSGKDPYAFFAIAKKCAKTDVVLEFEYFCPQGTDSLEFFYQPVSPQNSVKAEGLAKTERWRKVSFNLDSLSDGYFSKAPKNALRIDFGSSADVKISMRNIRLRRASKDELEKEKSAAEEKHRIASMARKIGEDLKINFNVRFESVKIFKDKIALEINMPRNAPAGALLARLEFWRDWSDPLNLGTAQLYDLPPSENGRVKISVPRFSEDGKDFMLSKWVVVNKTKDSLKPISHAAYASDFSAIQLDIPPAVKPENIKGMAGVSDSREPIFQDLIDMRITAATVNILLNSLFAKEGEAPTVSFKSQLREYKMDSKVVGALDRTFSFLHAHKIKASAILLVNFNDSTPERKSLIHPDAKSVGAYAMPDLSSEDGVRAYSAVVDFLSERYSGAHPEYGRIDNYILHNEVDYAADWTNMGNPPFEVYMRQYIKSMRLVEILARSRNPSAKVFASLTHNFKKERPDKSYSTYSPRDILDFLALDSAAEGDFQWGVAYHPYPLNLFKADVWNDAESLCRADFDTPFITPKNIDTLFRYLKKPELAQNGTPRTVIFSEQGFHSEYDERSFNIQSAALLYTFGKMKGYPNLESFHYHNWCDHPDEGGLKLGLRTLPVKGKPFGEKKAAWNVYKALFTPDEAAQTKSAREFLRRELSASRKNKGAYK